jgi:cation-transporting ATPase 13A1
VLFCGTEVIQTQGNLNFPEFIKGTHPHCLGLVLRTGFDTAKGRLIRSFFYNNENVQSKQVDGMVILVMLLVFAIISSANVLYHGLHDSSRDKNKLFLRCILIVTTVVPPELPMILSISVNQSLLFL